MKKDRIPGFKGGARSAAFKRRTAKKYLFLLSIVGLQLVSFAVFYVAVNINSILMAFQYFDTKGTMSWSLQHFATFFKKLQQEPNILLSLRNTVLFFLFGLFMLPVAFTTSYFMYKKIWGYKLFRVVFFFPSVISPVVWSQIYTNIVGVNGPVAAIMQRVSGTAYPPVLLGDTRYAIVFVVLYSFWMGFAGNFVLFSGSLVRIPDSVIEAGKIDGLKWLGELTRVIIPLVWPMLSTMITLSLVRLFTSSGNILLLTNGEWGTNTISFMIFQNVYNNGAPEQSGTFGYASAVGLIFTVLTLPLLFIATKLMNRVEDVQY
ncbi:MAG: sugar ABC transporter permease [Clostridiales bacterium]|nr:sugar ABC transporter permease [Clostridiales bacterium]